MERIDNKTMSDTGYLKIILGCMYSGKTSSLIRIYKYNKIAGIKTEVINYIDDNRYDPVKMSTHDGIKIDCLKFKNLNELFDKESDLIEKTDSFIINEGQFFNDLYDVVNKLVNEYNKVVYVGGLDGDFKMKKFGQILDLIPISDSVEKLTAICSLCKKKAAFTKRITKETVQTMIGGADKYIPVCRNCHKT
jgi:thymidine kinase